MRYVGEPVAVAAAEDLATAQAAVQAIRVEYDELPAVLTIEEALADGAPQLHDDLDAYEKSSAIE